jgi:hypothetical protein
MMHIADDRIEESLDLGQNRVAAAGSVVTIRPLALASGHYPQRLHQYPHILELNPTKG